MIGLKFGLGIIVLLFGAHANAFEREWHVQFDGGMALSPDMSGMPGATVRLKFGHDLLNWLGIDAHAGWSRYGNLVIDEGHGFASRSTSHRITLGALLRFAPPARLAAQLSRLMPFVAIGPTLQIHLDGSASIQDPNSGVLADTRSRQTIVGTTWDFHAGLLWRFSRAWAAGLSGHYGIPLTSQSRSDGGLMGTVRWTWSL